MLLPLALPTEINRSQLETGGLRIRPRFYSSTQMELSNKNYKDLMFLSELLKGIQRRLESQKEKKRSNIRIYITKAINEA